MRDVAIVSFAQHPSVRCDGGILEVEMLVPVIMEAVEKSGIPRKQIGFTCSGSADFLSGVPFSFVMGLDAVGAWPPIEESHVEMDGAWALYEAWVRLQHGDIDSALVYAFGSSSTGNLLDILTAQMDPYYQYQLGPDPVSVAAMQARAMLDSGKYTERDFAEVAARNRRNALTNPNAQVKGDFKVDKLLADQYTVAPLRKHDLPPISDGASAIILVAGDLARKVCKRPAWIKGIDHRIETFGLGTRDLTKSPSTKLAAEKAGVSKGKVDVAEIYAPYSHQELILREALGLGKDVDVNPSGGALAAHPFVVAGLNRFGEAAQRIIDGKANRAVAHATSGPCLQHNLVSVLESN